mgnify:FL=1
MASTDYACDIDGIATITINNPKRKNAMTYPMIEQMYEHLLTAAAEARVVILTGAEDAFCAGIDLDFLSSISPEERGIKVPTHDENGLWNITACPVPVIAAINGPAVGMGAEWTSHCDIRIASESGKFAWNFSHRGLVPDTGAGSWLLPRQIGIQPALRLLYSGEWLEAETALELGYVSEVVEPKDLMKAAFDEARTYLQGADSSHRLTKKLVYSGLSTSIMDHQNASREALLECFRSDDHHEGISAFAEGRKPNFKKN